MNILHSKIMGEHPKHLIITHGLFGQLDNWNTLGRKYAEHFSVHLVDLRNHGRSFHDDDTSQKAMAEDFLAYMNHHNIEKAHFIGHSLGGKVVMEMALNYPEKVEKLLVADMAPKSYPPHHQDILNGLNNVDFSKVERRSDVEPFLETHIHAPSVRQFLMKSVFRKDDGSYAFRFNFDALNRDYDDLTQNLLPQKTFEGPVLFLGGENSNYILGDDKPLIRGYFPHAEVEYVSKAGHWLHAENPMEFFEKSMAFFKR